MEMAEQAELQASIPTDITSTKSFTKITQHQFDYLYKQFKRHVRDRGARKSFSKTEFKGIILMLGVGNDYDDTEAMLNHLKEQWLTVEEFATTPSSQS